jgi:hypothetical protein
VDHDFGVQPQCADETACARGVMGEQANESDTVWIYSHSWPSDRAFPPVISEDIGKSSLKRITDHSTAADRQISDSLWLSA